INYLSTMVSIRSLYALQLNGGVQDVHQIKRIKEILPKTKIIIQLPAYRWSEIEMAESLNGWRSIEDYIDGMLLDGSGGAGCRENFYRMKMWHDKVSRRMPNHIVGVAGGLSVDDFPLLVDWLRKLNFFDCTSGLRVDNNFSVER